MWNTTGKRGIALKAAAALGGFLAREAADLAKVSGGALAFLMDRAPASGDLATEWVDATEDDLERGIHTGDRRPTGGMVDRFGQTEFMARDNLLKD